MSPRFFASVAGSLLLTCGLCGAEPPKKQAAPADASDWLMYNYDLRGTRHNTGERTLGKDNVARLEEKWRFPPKDSGEKVGVIHATPVVVNGHVYFGTATLPAVYKVGP